MYRRAPILDEDRLFSLEVDDPVGDTQDPAIVKEEAYGPHR